LSAFLFAFSVGAVGLVAYGCTVLGL
jgi:hypothetical protein